MSDSVPLIMDPRDAHLAALPFIHARARNQCLDAIRRAFEVYTGEQESVSVILHLLTRKGPKLMSMVANVVRNESELLVILTGREVECSLATLVHNYNNEGYATESAVVPSESNADANPNDHGAHEERFQSVSTRSNDTDDDENEKINVLKWADVGVSYREVPCGALASDREKRGRPTALLFGGSGRSDTVSSSVGLEYDDLDVDASSSVISSLTAPTGVVFLTSLMSPPIAHSEISSLTMPSLPPSVPVSSDELGDMVSEVSSGRSVGDPLLSSLAARGGATRFRPVLASNMTVLMSMQAPPS